ncbi:MAG TPA: hypothetical protein VI384_04425 [Candidatus Dormibacteraeota bacterium]
MTMRLKAATDANQADIAKALRAAGCQVQSLHQLGGGVPDLLVGRACCADHANGRIAKTQPSVRLWLLEVKDGSKPPSARKLTPDQVEWHKLWWGAPIVVCSVEEALRAVGLIP